MIERDNYSWHYYVKKKNMINISLIELIDQFGLEGYN